MLEMSGGTKKHHEVEIPFLQTCAEHDQRNIDIYRCVAAKIELSGEVSHWKKLLYILKTLLLRL